MLVLSLAVGIVVCCFLPIGAACFLGRRKKGAVKAFLIGALAFIVSQMLVRLPILQLVLPRFTWYALLPLHPWGYGLFLGLTAGLFEEGARWIAVRYFLKGQRCVEHGLAFGLGHGGVEAMLFVGLNLIAGLALVIAGQGALFPADAGSVLTAVAERVFAIAFHVGASLLVMYGVREGKALLYWAVAVALHTALDAAAVILPKVFGVGILGVELWAAALGGTALVWGILVYRRRRSSAAFDVL